MPMQSYTCTVCKQPFIREQLLRVRDFTLCCSRTCRDAYRKAALEDPLEARFNKLVGPPNEFGCRLWLGETFARTNYGIIGRHLAHRLAWELVYGPIPKGTMVLHTCAHLYAIDDFTSYLCVNHEHLYLGTSRNNIDDMVRDCRQRRGERSNKAKLTTEQVLEIRHLHATTDITHRQLGADFGVSHVAIRHILHRRHWRHI